MSEIQNNSPSLWAQRMGYGGVIPFAGLSAAVWLTPPDTSSHMALALLAYGGSILSFLGAIHWGLTMRAASEPRTTDLVWGVVPSLIAWVAVLLPAASGLLLITASLWACLAVDRHTYPRHGVQGWLAMRLWLTTLASGSCLAAATHLI